MKRLAEKILQILVSAINHLESEFKPLFVYARRSIEDAVIEALRPNEAGERRTLLRELRLDFQQIHQGGAQFN